MIKIEELIYSFNNEYDHTNTLDVATAISNLHICINEVFQSEKDESKKEEINLLLFYSEQLLDWFRIIPEDVYEIYATAYDLLCAITIIINN